MKKHVIIFSFLLLAAINLPTIAQNVGEAAPDFTINTGSGGTFTLSDNLGKVVMIFFFGADCGLCQESGPHVQGIYNSNMSDTNFVAIGLDTWPNSSDVKVNGFASASGITFPVGIDANSVKTAYGHTYDRLVVIDKDGIIRSKNNTRAINDINSVKSVIQTYLEDGVTAVDNVREQEERVSLYPIPAREILYADLILENSSEVQFAISDITGKVRKRTRLHLEAGAQHLEIDIKDLEHGLYFYTVYSENKVDSGKLIIQ